MLPADIKNFALQFAYTPKIENSAGAKKGFKKFIVAGMGGSHLAANTIMCSWPDEDMIVWSNYGLPPLPPHELKERLIIASSYSGNTEETLDALETARTLGYAVIAIGSGGALIETAKKSGVPYVKLPRLNIQPRMALGWSLKAMLKAIGKEKELAETENLTETLVPAACEVTGKLLAKKIRGKVPIICASLRNSAIAQIWKIKFNETGKIPAFWNTLPELNHNEMTGFDVTQKTRPLSKNFCFLLLEDAHDDIRIQKRMRVLRELYEKRGLPVHSAPISEKSTQTSSRGEKLNGKNSRLHEIFSSIILADWVSFYTANLYDTEPEQVPMIEEFKKLIT